MAPEGLEFLADWLDGMAARLPADAMAGMLDHCIEGIEADAPDQAVFVSH